MSEKELIQLIRKLPTEAQQEVVDFVEFLSHKYIQKPADIGFTGKRSIINNSFRGVWKDREDLQDSTKWIRELRKNRWSN